MANVTIGDLTAATSVSGTELLEIEQSGVSKRTTASLIAALGGGGTGNDSDDNYSANNFLTGYATTATAAGTTTLTVASEYQQYFTGSTTQTVKLPVASTLTLGHRFFIANASSGSVTVQSSGLNTVVSLAQDESAMVTCILASGTSAASWSVVSATSSVVTIASGTATLGTSAIASGALASVVTVAATGVATTDVIQWNPNGDISAVTGYAPVTDGGLIIYPYPTSDNVNFKVGNPTASSITPGAITLNWRVIR